MIYYSSKEPFEFRIFKTIRSFGEGLLSGKIIITKLIKNKQNQQNIFQTLIIKLDQKIKIIKKNVLNTAQNLYDGIELVINGFKR